MSVVIPTSTNRKAGRPKKEKSDAKFDKKAYMREYMKSYQLKNKDKQLARRNTSYYVTKHKLSQEFVDMYGINTANVYKCMEIIKKIENECPQFLSNIKEFVETLVKDNEENKKNHVADLSGVEVLNEIE
jgi:hypothetical protein